MLEIDKMVKIMAVVEDGIPANFSTDKIEVDMEVFSQIYVESGAFQGKWDLIDCPEVCPVCGRETED